MVNYRKANCQTCPRCIRWYQHICDRWSEFEITYVISHICDMWCVTYVMRSHITYEFSFRYHIWSHITYGFSVTYHIYVTICDHISHICDHISHITYENPETRHIRSHITYGNPEAYHIRSHITYENRAWFRTLVLTQKIIIQWY